MISQLVQGKINFFFSLLQFENVGGKNHYCSKFQCFGKLHHGENIQNTDVFNLNLGVSYFSLR